MFYSRITSFTVLTLLTPWQTGEGILVTSASKHSTEINTAESEFTLLPPFRLIAHWTPLKDFQGPEVKHCLAQTLDSVRKKGTIGAPVGGFWLQTHGGLEKQDLVQFWRDKGHSVTVFPATSPYSAEGCNRRPGVWCPQTHWGCLWLATCDDTSSRGDTCLPRYLMSWMKGTLSEIRSRKRQINSAFGLGMSAVIAFWMHPSGPLVLRRLPSPHPPSCHCFPPFSSPSFTSPTHLFICFLIPPFQPQFT